MKPYKKNPRKISDKQFQELADWLRELGDLSGIVHDLNSDEIVGGNQRSKVFDIDQCNIVIEHTNRKPDSQGTVKLGYVIWEGKRYFYRAVRWTKKQCEKANIIANKAGGEWDWDILKEQFSPDDLAQWGFDADELLGKGIKSNKVVDAKPKFDQADKLLKKWKVKRGDLWAVGDHRLICGDSADAAMVSRLFDSIEFKGKGEGAALFSTDPPYMVDYDGTARPGGGKDWSSKYKESTIKDKGQFLLNVFQAWQPYLNPNAAWFIWHASETRSLFEKAMQECGIHVHQEIIWVKPVFVIGYAVYYFKHEPCLFGWPKGKKPFQRKHFFSGQETTVWETAAALDGDGSLREDIIAELHTHSDVWFIDWQGKKRPGKSNHPTEKPLEIFARPMRNHTKSGELCAEPFCGSGSQILAGENEGRLVLACEIEPAFVAVALQRF